MYVVRRLLSNVNLGTKVYGDGSKPIIAIFGGLNIHKLGNVVHCGPVVFVCFENKHLAISITLMALSVTMDFAPCSNALRFTALRVHFVLFPMGFTSPCANQRKKTLGSQQYVRIVLHT